METYDPYDIVVGPFPFTDMEASKRRPALVLSGPGFHETSGHLVLAMVTTAQRSRWPSDIVLKDLKTAGLPKPSVVRAKLFTLDKRFILRKLGTLGAGDQKRVAASIASILGIFD